MKNTYSIEVVLKKRVTVSADSREEACDIAFTDALEYLPDGCEIWDTEVVE